MLYFAYGANTDLKSMAVRCPAAVPLFRARIDGYRLEFKGCADIVPVKRAHVEGAVWRITTECERALDRFEGFPSLYRKEYGVFREDGKPDEEIMWYAMNRTDLAVPSEYYTDTLRKGYRAFGIKRAQLDAAVRRAHEAVRAQARAHDAQRRAARDAKVVQTSLMLKWTGDNGFRTGAWDDFRPGREDH